MQSQFIALKKAKHPITAVAANCFYMARIASISAIDTIIVNDSQANLMTFGLSELCYEQLVYCTLRANAAAANKTIISILSNEYPEDGLSAVKKLSKAGATAIAINIREKELITSASRDYQVIPIIDNVTNPQHWDLKELKQQVKDFERIGCPAIYVIGLPLDIGNALKDMALIPIIGSGSGKLDGQSLSIYDVLGLSGDFCAPWAKSYMNGTELAVKSINEYCSDSKYDYAA